MTDNTQHLISQGVPQLHDSPMNGPVKKSMYHPLRFRSTGLGKTLIEGEAAEVKVVDDALVVHIQAATPVKWRIRAALSYRGLLQCLRLALTPSVLKFILLGWRTRREPRLPEEF